MEKHMPLAISSIWEKLSSSSDIYLCPAGLMSKNVFDLLKTKGINVTGYFDAEPKEKYLDRVPVYSYSDVENIKPEIIIVCHDAYDIDIVEEFSHYDFNNWGGDVINLAEMIREIRISEIKNENEFVTVGNSILGNTFNIDYRVPRRSPSMSIGDDCILLNKNIFESDQGFIEIGNGTFINGGTSLISRTKISIGNNVTIAWGCTIYDHDSHSLNYLDRIEDQRQQLKDWNAGNFILNKNWSVVNSKPITIEDNVWIGFDVLVLKGVTIGEGAIIGAKSVVTHDIPAWTIAAGNPARVVKKIKRD